MDDLDDECASQVLGQSVFLKCAFKKRLSEVDRRITMIIFEKQELPPVQRL